MLNRIGDKLSPSLKYWLFLVGITAVIFAVVFGSFAASYLHLAPEEQALVETLFDKLIPFPFIGAILLMLFIGVMVSLLFRSYIIPILSMAEQTRLITAANPEYRITTGGARELSALARVINESADAYHELQRSVEGRVHRANAALAEERNRLAALMSELPHGVVVCTREGRILLYNRHAQTMLQPAAGRREGGGVGLGRSIFGVLERDPLVHALEVMNHAAAKDQAQPVIGLMTKLCGARYIRVNMAPVTTDDPPRALSGFVLSLEDITGEMEADNERDLLLQGMVDALQGALNRLQMGLDAVCDDPRAADAGCSAHRRTIARVAGDLEEQLAMTRQLFGLHRSAIGHRENVLADTLMTLLAKSFAERFAVRADCGAEQTIWLKIDSYALVQALTTLAGLLKSDYGITAVQLQVDADGESQAALSMRWPEQTVPTRALEGWRSSPLFMAGDGTADTPDSIAAAQGGSIAAIGTDMIFCRGVSLALPTALADELADLQSPLASRPVSYEFDLFHQPGQSALGAVELRKLTYVAFDTETTGLNPSLGDEILQLGAVRIVNGRLLHHECVDQLVNPLRPVPKSSVAIHGIDPDLLPSQPTIDEVLPAFHAFAADAVLVAHNAAFDMRFLQLKQEAAGVSFDNPVLDTLLLSSVVHPHQESHTLDAIAERLNVTVVGRHTALGDALVTAEILLKLIPLLEAQGIRTLEEALRAASRSPFARLKY